MTQKQLHVSATLLNLDIFTMQISPDMSFQKSPCKPISSAQGNIFQTITEGREKQKTFIIFTHLCPVVKYNAHWTEIEYTLDKSTVYQGSHTHIQCSFSRPNEKQHSGIHLRQLNSTIVFTILEYGCFTFKQAFRSPSEAGTSSCALHLVFVSLSDGKIYTVEMDKK